MVESGEEIAAVDVSLSEVQPGLKIAKRLPSALHPTG
jgi:hypothetical protein